MPQIRHINQVLLGWMAFDSPAIAEAYRIFDGVQLIPCDAILPDETAIFAKPRYRGSMNTQANTSTWLQKTMHQKAVVSPHFIGSGSPIFRRPFVTGDLYEVLANFPIAFGKKPFN